MKNHVLDLIYLQYSQVRTLAEDVLKNNEIDSEEGIVDILNIVLNIVGYPEDHELSSYSRDKFYVALAEIATTTSDEIAVKQKIEEFYHWICGEVLFLYQIKRIRNIDFLQNVLGFKLD